MDIKDYLRQSMGMLPSEHVEHEMEEIEHEEEIDSGAANSDDILMRISAELGEDALESEIESEEEEEEKVDEMTVDGPRSKWVKVVKSKYPKAEMDGQNTMILLKDGSYIEVGTYDEHAKEGWVKN